MYRLRVALVIFFASISLLSAGKITPSLQSILDTLSSGRKTRVCVYLTEKPNLAKFPQKRYIKKIDYLKNFCNSSQQPLLNFLSSCGNKVESVKSFWVFNGIVFSGTAPVIYQLALKPNVEYVTDNEFSNEMSQFGAGLPTALNEWNIERVNAPKVWNNPSYSYTGEGIVILGMDSGIRHTHETFSGRLRSSYGWYDAVDDSTNPLDQNGHGTHTLGIAVGASRIGVAKECSLMAVRISDSMGNFTIEDVHEGFQWIADLDPEYLPDVINCSWGQVDNGLYPGPHLDFWQDILTIRALDIIPVFCIGNVTWFDYYGWDPGKFPTVIAVGATDYDDEKATFSLGHSRDTIPYNNVAYWARPDWDSIKPDLVAPGVKVDGSSDTLNWIRSALPNSNTSYGYMKGTSQAAPHVAGAIALMFEAALDTFGYKIDFYDIYNILLESADSVNQHIPDNDYGWGRLDCKTAVDSVLRFHLKSSSPKALTTNNQRKIIYDPQEGITHLVYQSGKYIRYTNDSISTWKYERKVSDGEYPCIVLDDSGDVHCVFKDGLNIMYNRRTDGTWEDTSFTLYSGLFDMDISPPSFMISSDTGYIAFEVKNQWMQSYMKLGIFDITSASPSLQSTNLENTSSYRFGAPCIGRDQNNIYIAYTRDILGIREVYYRSSVDTFSTTTIVSTNDLTQSTNPMMLATPTKVWFFWEEDDPADIYYRVWADTIWADSIPVPVDTNAQDEMSPRACYHPQHTDRIYLAWSKYINGNWEIYTSAYYNGWQTPTYVSQSDSADSKDPDVTYIPSMIGGTLVTAYTEGNKRWCSRGKFLPLYTIKINKAGAGIGGPQGSESELAKPFLFERILPNPGKGLLKIKFNSPDERHVTVKIYDVVGKKVKTVFDSKAQIGVNEFIIQPADFPAGVYFVRLEAYSYERTEKVILLK